MGRENHIPKIARVTLETLTPLHIGSGLSVVWDGQQWADCQQILQGARLGASNEPYIPGSTIRGMLRAMYAFALEMKGRSLIDADRETENVFGSTSTAGGIMFGDLFPGTAITVSSQEKTLSCLCSRYPKPGQCTKRQASFRVQVIPSQTVFEGEVISYWPEYNRHHTYFKMVLGDIFSYGNDLTDVLKANGNNPEVSISSSPINGLLFQQNSNQYIITWKLGKYTKSYSKALTQYPKLKTKPPAKYPYAYYVIKGTGNPLGWVKITINLDPHDDKGQSIAEFRLNEWR